MHRTLPFVYNTPFLFVMLFSSVFILITALPHSAVYAGTYYIAPYGSDRTADGSETKPWQTLTKAIKSVPDDGSVIIAKDGLYTGFMMPHRAFSKPCRVKAEHPHQARFTGKNGGNRVMYLDALSRVIFDGLHIYGNGSDNGEYLIQIATENTHHLVFQNCIIHDSYKNDLIKLNHFANKIRFTNCVFFNPNNHGGDEHFDINTARDVIIEDSIFFNDFAGSGRAEDNQSHSFIVVKNSENEPNVSQYITIRRNIFLNWSGLPDQAYILLGEDNKDFFEAADVLIENNLFLHNQTVRTVGTFLFKGGLRRVTVRANTITGEPFRLKSGLFGGYAAVFWKLSRNPPQEDILFAGNIFCNNAGSSLRFSAGKQEYFVDGGFKAVSNVYWNGKNPVKAERDDIFVPKNDPRAILTSPKLPDVPAKLPLPRIENAASAENFSIRKAFESLVKKYAVPAPGSSAIGSADPKNMPEDDILGKKRSKNPDIGCYETEK
ncbi:MAG: hypothetical protein LBT46_07835 [Planctomycetaceae bacterium]|jgi:hypothetical protein|nr:hypothetical protein [Planctomycetaceae bacterium]